ncbi:MAG: hypothetical protein ACRC5C_13140 [Bacilli bacterium]
MVEFKNGVFVVNAPAMQKEYNNSVLEASRMGFHMATANFFTYKGEPIKAFKVSDKGLVMVTAQKGDVRIPRSHKVFRRFFAVLEGLGKMYNHEEYIVAATLGQMRNRDVHGRKKRQKIVLTAIEVANGLLVNEEANVSFSISEVMDLIEKSEDKASQLFGYMGDEGNFIFNTGWKFQVSGSTKISDLGKVGSLLQENAEGKNWMGMLSELCRRQLSIAKETTNGTKIVKGFDLSDVATIKSIDAGESTLLDAINKLAFTSTTVVHGNEAREYNGFGSTISQSRVGNAMLFSGVELQLAYLRANNLVPEAFSSKHGNKCRMDMLKAIKRIYAGASSGVNIMRCFKGCTATFESKEFVGSEGTFSYDYVVYTDKKTGEKTTLAFVKGDVEAIVNEPALITEADANGNATGVKVLDNSIGEEANEIRKIVATDGTFYVDYKTHDELVASGKILAGPFQGRAFAAIKGAAMINNPACELLQANFVFFDSSVKEKNVFTESFRNAGTIDFDTCDKSEFSNAFNLYCVGQVAPGNGGVFLATQATECIEIDAEYKKEQFKKFVDMKFDEIKAMKIVKPQEEDVCEETDETEEEDFKIEDSIIADFIDLNDERLNSDRYIYEEAVKQAFDQFNQFFMNKTYVEDAKSKMMFWDVLAVYNAMAKGRLVIKNEDMVIKSGEVVTAKNGEFLEGLAVAMRYPMNSLHQLAKVLAKTIEAYREMVERGLLDNVVMFCAASWDANKMGSADGDGDRCVITFSASIVKSVTEAQARKFGGYDTLPLIDVWMSEDGRFGTGCPTPPKSKETTHETVVVADGVTVTGDVLEYEVGKEDIALDVWRNYIHEATAKSIQKADIGIISNFTMTVQAMRRIALENGATRDDENIIALERDNLLLSLYLQFEIDSAKTGGAHKKMPIFIELMDRLQLKKCKTMEDVKALANPYMLPLYSEVAGKIKKNTLDWKALQKMKHGINVEGDTYQEFVDFVKHDMETRVAPLFLQEDVKKQYTFEATKKVITDNVGNYALEYASDVIDDVRNLVHFILSMREELSSVKKEHLASFKEINYGKKTRVPNAVINADFRKSNPHTAAMIQSLQVQVSDYLRAGAYKIANDWGLDVRYVVAKMYEVVSLEQLRDANKSSKQASSEMDGYKLRLKTSTGKMSMVYETMKPELVSLLSGDIQETPFVLVDLPDYSNAPELVRVEESVAYKVFGDQKSPLVRPNNLVGEVTDKTTFSYEELVVAEFDSVHEYVEDVVVAINWVNNKLSPVLALSVEKKFILAKDVEIKANAEFAASKVELKEEDHEDAGSELVYQEKKTSEEVLNTTASSDENEDTSTGVLPVFNIPTQKTNTVDVEAVKSLFQK